MTLGVDRETTVVLVVNGDYARELVEAAEVLVGALRVRVVRAMCQLGADELRGRLGNQIAEHTEGKESVLLITDLWGSTPSNVCLEHLGRNPGWELLSGLNLPMLLKLATCDRSLDAREMALKLRATSSESFKQGSLYLPKETSSGD
jgi:mannose/fructose-specific phosphotransferase system component IIA